jgi:hypothetical protein
LDHDHQTRSLRVEVVRRIDVGSHVAQLQGIDGSTRRRNEGVSSIYQAELIKSMDALSLRTDQVDQEQNIASIGYLMTNPDHIGQADGIGSVSGLGRHLDQVSKDQTVGAVDLLSGRTAQIDQ